MITVVARWETTQMPPETEFQLWRQLRGAFQINRMVFVPIMPSMVNYSISQYDTMEEALASCTGERVFLEPTGTKGMHDIPEGDIVLVLGDSGNSNLQYAQDDETYIINTPSVKTHLYGVNAAAIALAIRYGQ
jgi:hypothetical protein